MILHATSSAPSGNHIPWPSWSAARVLDARSIGTSNTVLMGSTSDKKIGISKYAGVPRNGKYWRSRISDRQHTRPRATSVAAPEPIDDAAMEGDQQA